RLLGSLGSTLPAALASSRNSAASVLSIRFSASARSIPLSINARSVNHGGLAEADPERSMAASASTAARPAARVPMKDQTLSLSECLQLTTSMLREAFELLTGRARYRFAAGAGPCPAGGQAR